MTAGTNDRALWVAAQEDYTNALAIAVKAWRADDAAVDDATIQAAAATILIHITKLRSEERIHVRVPEEAVPGFGRGPRAVASKAIAEAMSKAGALAVAGIPPACPQCGGKVWDNRENKKNPKAPDWKCRDKECKDDKGFTTGGWVEKPKAGKANAYAGKNAQPSSYEEPPVALREPGEDDLPF
jgi:hypothetical protein